MNDSKRTRALARAVSIAKAEVVVAAIAYVDAKLYDWLPSPTGVAAAFVTLSHAVTQYQEAL